MSFPITGTPALALAVLFGIVFGFLLQRGRVTDYNVIVNQFRLRDFTVVKVMLTAIIVGGLGVLFLVDHGQAKYHIKDANMLGLIIGSAIFGIGMVLYGYCPGTALAAIGTGSLHALIGSLGMILGGIVYALSFDWVSAHILKVWAYGKVRLPDITGLSDPVWFGGLIVLAAVVFTLIERSEAQKAG
jgi:uncharacterized membrane protein YedE/YeeE